MKNHYERHYEEHYEKYYKKHYKGIRAKNHRLPARSETEAQDPAALRRTGVKGLKDKAANRRKDTGFRAGLTTSRKKGIGA